MLLKNNELENQDEEDLMEILFDEPIAIDVDKQDLENETWKERLADRVTEICGSWGFIISFVFILIFWMGINLWLAISGNAFDPYPFILLNLVLSCIAALQAPIIMMSQNRAAKKDTLRGKNDYKIDLKSELILEELHDQIKKLQYNQNKILKLLEKENSDDK
ncbi:MAG: DUF1003 domain-containing protein [Bacilli bacterium]|nr:DUF1003 domain-containing protein [Bacilli bacterium]